MVKRKHQRKFSKDSSDESEIDFYEEVPSQETQQPKYSLRQRRGTNLLDDFDYDVADENDGANVFLGTEELRSDDEDFHLDATKESSFKVSDISSVQKCEIKRVEPVSFNCTIRKYKEREIVPAIPLNKQSFGNMIDFEDVIRADVLVNQSKIDYDSIIEKSEIKVEKREIEIVETEKNELVEKKIRNKELPKKQIRKQTKKKLKEDELCENKYESNDSTGLPINTVLGVTESLYELAERYHMQRDTMTDELVSMPVESIMNESSSPESTKTASLEITNKVLSQQTDSQLGNNLLH